MTAPLFEDLDRMVRRHSTRWWGLRDLLVRMRLGGASRAEIAEEVEWVAGVRVPEPVIGDWLRQIGRP